MTDRASASRRERSAPRQLASAEAVRPATLDVYVKPYGMLSVDGGKPFEVVIHKTVSLPPGRHTLRLEREGAGAEELVLPLAAGERRSWTPALPAR